MKGEEWKVKCAEKMQCDWQKRMKVSEVLFMYIHQEKILGKER